MPCTEEATRWWLTRDTLRAHEGWALRKTLPLTIQHIRTDPEGSYAVLTGMWEGTTLNLISIYVPSLLQGQVLPELSALLLALPVGTLIAGRDYNMIMDKTRDRWPSRVTNAAKLPLAGFVAAFGLADFHSGAHRACPE